MGIGRAHRVSGPDVPVVLTMHGPDGRAARLAAREAARTVEGRRSTASQEALRLELEERKARTLGDARARKAADAERRHEAARAKRRKRKRGR